MEYKVKTPIETYQTEFNPDGSRGRIINLHAYVALLTEIDGHKVKAVRYDGYKTKDEVHNLAVMEYPDWNIKGVYRLYDEDF